MIVDDPTVMAAPRLVQQVRRPGPPNPPGRRGDATQAASPSNFELASASGPVPPRTSAAVCRRRYPPVDSMGEAHAGLPRDAFGSLIGEGSNAACRS